MGRRGPQPKPSALKHLQGTYRPDRAPAREWEPERLTADEALRWCPKALPENGRRLWRHLAPQLAAAGLLTRADVPAFAGCCMAYDRALRADAEVERDGLTIVTDKGFRLQHPAVSIGRTAWAEFRRFCLDFGLTPAARSRVNARPELPSEGAEGAGGEGASVTSLPRFRFGRAG